jgi:hypothetical protein
MPPGLLLILSTYFIMKRDLPSQGSLDEAASMAENPYQPSLVPPWAPPAEPRRGISVLAIFLGVLTDVGGTFIFSMCLGIVLAVFLLSQGAAPEEIQQTARTPMVWLVAFVPGMCLSILGGFVAARVAKRSELLHGAMSGSISAIFALLMQFTQSNPVWYMVASTLIVPPLAVLGARLAMIGRRRQQMATETSGA